MKTLFLTFFLLIVLAFAGAGAFLVSSMEPANFMRQVEKVGLFDLTEKLLPKLATLTGVPDIEEKADEQLGLCRYMSYPDPKDSSSLTKITPLPGERVKFLMPLELEKKSLQCKFNGAGKPVLFVPLERTGIEIRRALDQSGTISFDTGQLSILSDQLDLFVNVPGIEIHLRSKGPVVMRLKSDPGKPVQADISIGDVDVTYRPVLGSAGGKMIYFSYASGLKLTSNGSVINNKDRFVLLRPSGFEGAATENETARSNTAPPLPDSIFSELFGDPTHRPMWDKIAGLVADVSDRQRLAELATLFPRAYGFRFACQFLPDGTTPKTQSVLPGEWIDAPAGGALTCPDHVRLRLEAGTRLRLRQSEGVPFFHLPVGEVKVEFGESRFFVRTPAYITRIDGLSPLQRMTFSALPKINGVDCGVGEAKALIGLASAAGRSPLLVSRKCRLEIEAGSGVSRTLFAGDRLRFENLGLGRAFLPSVTDSELTAFSDTPIYTPVALTSIHGTPGKIAWQMPPDFENRECTLYAQKSENDAPKPVDKFKGKLSGETQVDPAFVPGFAALVCSNEDAHAASRLVATVTQ